METKHVGSTHQLADLSAKPLGKSLVEFIFNKLGMIVEENSRGISPHHEL